NSKIIGKKIILTPQKDGYTVQLKHSSIKKMQYKLLGKPLLTLKKQKFNYNETISTKYFRLKINKLSNFKEPIKFKLNGDHRYIYEKIIKKSLNISQVEKEVSIIKIAYKDNIRKRAIAYIDSLTDSLVKESVKNKTEENKKVLEFINQELSRTKDKLKKSEKELERYRISNKVIQPSVQASTFIKELSELDISISENRLKESIVENLIKFVKGNYNLDSIAPSLMELDEKPTLKLISILQDTQLKRDGLLADFTEKHPDVKALESKINLLRNKINLNINNLQKQIEQKSSNLKKLKASYESELKTLPIKERKLINIERDYEVSSKMYNFLLKKQAENEIIQVATLSDYRVIDKAYSNSSPVSPKSKIIIIVFIMLGLIIGIIIAYIHNAIKDKIRSVEDIESEIDSPIYGTIPALKDNIARLDVYTNPNAYFAESYRTLRTNLQLSLNREDSECKVILVSSTISGEGKNITAVNLSAIFQMANYKVITIDLDMRTPTVAKLFNMETISADISSYLREESSMEEIIYPTIYKNLNIIPVKESPSNPSELILSARLPQLIKELKKSYDYIIINSTPFGAITDTKHIMKFSDINLVLFREDYSKKIFMSKLKSMIERDRVESV
ncbi:polysaccharide biosynthesis tyrosine autokinase, partial [Sulfurovum sp. bin170]|uniref:GumC family protein n=1 Tax=Sulfurovum sp. bin170 TaxID=2695268 RepID=UPI0013DF2E61